MSTDDELAAISYRHAQCRKPGAFELWAIQDGARLLAIAREQQETIERLQSELESRGEQGCATEN